MKSIEDDNEKKIGDQITHAKNEILEIEKPRTMSFDKKVTLKIMSESELTYNDPISKAEIGIKKVIGDEITIPPKVDIYLKTKCKFEFLTFVVYVHSFFYSAFFSSS